MNQTEKLCPFMGTAESPWKCAGESCALFIKSAGGCAFAVLAEGVTDTSGTIDRIADSVGDIVQYTTPASCGDMSLMYRGKQ